MVRKTALDDSLVSCHTLNTLTLEMAARYVEKRGGWGVGGGVVGETALPTETKKVDA